MRYRRLTTFDAEGPRPVFLRLVIPDVHPRSMEPTGVVQAAYRLRRHGPLAPDTRRHLDRELDWLNANLARPSRFVRTKSKGFYHRAPVAISWFRSEAADHIAHAERIAAIVADHGMAVQVLRTAHPGYVVYRDAHQVVAIPFRDRGSARA
jgi:hypothetical protein